MAENQEAKIRPPISRSGSKVAITRKHLRRGQTELKNRRQTVVNTDANKDRQVSCLMDG